MKRYRTQIEEHNDGRKDLILLDTQVPSRILKSVRVVAFSPECAQEMRKLGEVAAELNRSDFWELPEGYGISKR